MSHNDGVVGKGASQRRSSRQDMASHVLKFGCSVYLGHADYCSFGVVLKYSTNEFSVPAHAITEHEVLTVARP